MTSTGASHSITFSRLRANFTVDKELIGKQDPYVIFQSGSSRAQTKAIKGVGTGTAEWKETYTLEKFSPSSSTVIEVTVYNHNTLLPDNVIGAGQVDLSNQGQSSLSGSGEPISVILTDKKGQETGTISFVTNGGGYSGRGGATSGTSGVSSGTGYGSGAGVASGAGIGSTGTSSGTGLGSGTRNSETGLGSGTRNSETGLGSGTGVGSGSNYGSGTGSGSVVGTGVGSDKRTAQQASDAAAREGREVTIEENNRVGVGRPVGGSTTGSTTGVTSGVTSGHSERDAVYGVREGDVIDRKYYVGTESRPQDQALVEQYREHNPYAKDYETTVQHTGRERLVNSQIEALGTRERVIGQDHHVHSHPVSEIARHLPASGANIPGVEQDAGAMTERPGGEGWVQTKPGPICDTNTFSITGDRTVDKERVTDLREHREFEKEFEVKTRLVAERVLDRGVDAEILNRERVLVDEKNKIACEGHPSASVAGSGETLASTGYGSGTGVGNTGYGSGTGVGSTGAGYGSGTGTGVGNTGYGSGTGVGSTGAGYGSQTGSGYGSGTGTGSGTGRSTLGEKAAGFIPGSEENADKKQGYQPGTGPSQNQGNVTTGEKVASYIPGTEENKEKKQTAQYA